MGPFGNLVPVCPVEPSCPVSGCPAPSGPVALTSVGDPQGTTSTWLAASVPLKVIVKVVCPSLKTGSL